jgi:hypothetical protein
MKNFSFQAVLDGLGNIFDIFSTKIKNFSGMLSSELQKFPKSSKQIFESTSKTCSCKISAKKSALYSLTNIFFFTFFEEKF